MAPEGSAAPQASVPPAALPDGSPPDGDKNQTNNVLEGEEPWEVQRREIPLRVDVEWLDFDHFKNRYSEKEGLAIIEVLCGHSQIAHEVSREIMQRARGKKDIREPRPTPRLTVDGDSYWMQRVRIQSPQLILLLSRLTGHRDKWSTDKPHTFFAPFRGFYYYLPQLKQSLMILEARWATAEASGHSAPPMSPTSETQTKSKQRRKRPQLDGDPGRGSFPDSDDDYDATANTDRGPMAPGIAVSGEVIDSPITLAHIRRFVNFIEKHIVPRWHRAAGTSQRKFRFVDLWMAFQPGELLYVPLSSDSPQNSDIAQGSSPRMYQTAWRLYSLVLDPVKDDKPDDTQKVSRRDLDVHTYYMDYDGNSYVPVRHTFVIKDYEGERDITTLEVYPMRFAKDAKKIGDTLRGQGNWFRQVVTKKHLSYDGWTLTHGPTGASSGPKTPLAVEHIDGDVIIDFVEGYKSEPSLGPGPSSWNQGLTEFDDSDWPAGDDDLCIMHWKPTANSARLETFAQTSERTQRGEWYSMIPPVLTK